MRLHEYEARAIFKKEGIPVPEDYVAATVEEAKEIALRLGLPLVIKAQVLVGGRGLAGGIKFANNLKEVEEVARSLLGKEIKGLPVRKILVRKKIEIEKELYLGVTIDGFKGEPLVLVSSEGGVSIEEIVKERPEKVIKKSVDIFKGLRLFEAREFAKEMGLRGREMIGVAGILEKLYRVFRKYDAMIAEINPLAISPTGEIWAIDAVLEIDDAALYRHKDIEVELSDRFLNPLERAAREMGVSYIDLDGEVGIIASGAGLGMATMDIIGKRLKPANFLETGGGISADLLYKVMGLVLKKEGLKAVFINLYGGINPINEGAKGIVKYIADYKVKIPIVAKALGNRQEETWEILKSGGVKVVTDIQTEKGVEELFRILEGE